MIANKVQVKQLRKSRKPSTAWVSAGDGWFYAPDDFAQSTAFLSDDFTKFSRRSRRRWDLIEFFKDFFSKK